MTGVENTPELRQQLVDLCASEIGPIAKPDAIFGLLDCQKHAPKDYAKNFKKISLR